MRPRISRTEEAIFRLRRMGNSSGDENGSDAMKYYWEIIAENLKKRGWSLGYVSAVDSQGRTSWIADAHRGDGNVSFCGRMKS
jgi:hypothetical protein